jgi:GNAT superfamily N-acetyltransferase
VSGAGELELRPPRPADVDGMLALVAACDESWREWAPDGWEPPPPGSARWVSELGAPDRWTRVSVEPSGRIVGIVSWNVAREGLPYERPIPGVAHLGALFVHPDRWREGIAGRLLDAALDAMREQGYVRVRLNTPEGAPAEALYRARGWQREGEASFHQVVRLPSVRYVREL